MVAPGPPDDPAGPGSFAFTVLAHSAAAPPEVFALLADATGWHEWAGPMIVRSSWERPGDTSTEGVGAVRRLGFPPVVGRERIVAYDPPTHHAYVVDGGLPVRAYRADVHLSAEPAGTRIEWSAAFVPLVAGTGPLLLVVLRSMVGGFARRLARAAAERSPGA